MAINVVHHHPKIRNFHFPQGDSVTFPCQKQPVSVGLQRSWRDHQVLRDDAGRDVGAAKDAATHAAACVTWDFNGEKNPVGDGHPRGAPVDDSYKSKFQ